MGSTGLLPYVHGIDFSHNDFTDQTFQGRLGQLQSLRWVNLDNMRLCKLPNDLFKLHKLEYLSVANNQLLSIHGDLSNLPALRSINFSRNRLKNYGIPPDLFSLKELSTVDMSHNELFELPQNIEDAKSLLILNLSHNNISTIDGDFFKSLIGLVYLNLSHNQFENFPPQLRRLLNLKVLILSGNPLSQCLLRQLGGLKSLQTLELHRTFRTDQNIPSNLGHLTYLTKIDLSQNELTKIPECLYSLSQLDHLNLSDNNIDALSHEIEAFSNLTYLNLSRNRLTMLPSSIYKLFLLETLYLCGNRLDQTGLPSGLHRLTSIVHINLSNNNFVTLPDSLFRCKKLRKLNVSDNKLKTLPIAFHRRKDISIDYSHNPDFVFPPQPVTLQLSTESAYGIDFSLSAQLKASGVLSPKPAEVKLTEKELLFKKLKSFRKKEARLDPSSDKVLEGMKVNAEKSREMITHSEISVKKRWDEHLERPKIDYSNLFEPHVGNLEGVVIFEMNEFYPVELSSDLFTHFFLGDCYLILETIRGDRGDLSYEIYYLIGPDASVDKKSSAAIHAVNLRNFLNAVSRTHREEMRDESTEFLSLLQREGIPLRHAEGEHGLSGLFSSVMEPVSSSNKCYLLIIGRNVSNAVPMPVSRRLLRERPGLYLLELNSEIYIYASSTCSDFSISKAGLIGENVNKHEYKSKAYFEIVREGVNDSAFLGMLEDEEYNSEQVDQLLEASSKLYRVNFNNRFLELPQAGSLLLRRCDLDSTNVYILDTISVIYVWRGKKSPIILCNAGLKLSEELFIMIPRPKHSCIKFFKEGDETIFFKSCFDDWDSLLALGSPGRMLSSPSLVKDQVEGDHSKAYGKLKTDISALFLPRRPDFSAEESESILLDYQENSELLIAYVFERRKFVGLPKEKYGLFYSNMCYLFICTVLNIVDDEEEVTYQAYFWEGVHAPVGGWLQFMLSLRPSIERTLKTTLDIVRLGQQKEDLRFLSLFDRRFVICRNEEENGPQMFVVRKTAGILTLRCIQVDVSHRNLNSNLCCLLVVPFEGHVSGVVYVWVGERTSPEESKIAEEIAFKYFGSLGYIVTVVDEGSEPENYFWDTLGGRFSDYDKEDYFLKDLRLFRGSTENDLFTVVEKYSDFCRNDLSDDFPMILDDGKHVFVWVPVSAKEVDLRLALHSSSVYIKHLANVQAAKPRKLMIQRQHRESNIFKRCFHGWSLN